MRYMASSQVLSGRCVPWRGVPEVTLNRYRQPRQLNRLGRVDSRRTSSLEQRRQRTPFGQRAASSQVRQSVSERNLSSRPCSVQSFMITIYRTAPAHQNRVQQGNDSGYFYEVGETDWHLLHYHDSGWREALRDFFTAHEDGILSFAVVGRWWDVVDVGGPFRETLNAVLEKREIVRPPLPPAPVQATSVPEQEKPRSVGRSRSEEPRV